MSIVFFSLVRNNIFKRLIDLMSLVNIYLIFNMLSFMLYGFPPSHNSIQQEVVCWR